MAWTSGGLVIALTVFSYGAAATETMVVTASRAPEELRTLPASVTIIGRQDLEEIAEAGQGLGYVLARLAPGMGPETNSVSNFGQQLQGRKVLILIDGIPQTENRQISRQLNTIQVSSIQRIEIISGATAIYGADAIGGVIHIITRDYAAAPLQQESRVNASASDKASVQHSGALQLEHTASGTFEDWHYRASASWEKRAATFDAHGQLIPPEPAQNSRDQVQAVEGLFKVAYDLAAGRRLEWTANAYRDQQNLDYTVATDPYRAVWGLKLAEQPASERYQLALRYEDEGFTAQVYQRARRYRFFPFVLTSPFPLINQSTSESKVLGARLQWDWQSMATLRWIYGVDYEDERGEQKARAYKYAAYMRSEGLDYQPETDLYDYGPDVRTQKISPFVQSRWSLTDTSHLQAGVRHEQIRQKIADFTPPLETAIALNYTMIRLGIGQLEQAQKLPAGTLARLPAVYPKSVYAGGTKSFQATAWNFGYAYTPDAQQQLYVNYAQGYELADTARLMRDAVADGSYLPWVAAALKLNVKTTSTADVDVATIYTQSVNAGYRRQTRAGQQSLNLFYNQSDKSYRFNKDFSVDLVSRLQEVYGWEAAAAAQLADSWQVGGSYVMAWGRVREDHSWLRLAPVEVNPPKLTLHGTYALSSQASLRAQTTQVFSQRGSERADVVRIRGYTTEDLQGLWRLSADSTLRLGISNVFNHDYKTVFHQWAEATYGAGSGAPASGRRFNLGYEHLF